MSLLGKLLGKRRPAVPCEIHEDDQVLITAEDRDWWESLTSVDFELLEQEDNFFLVTVFKKAMEADGLSQEEAGLKARRSFPSYYRTLARRADDRLEPGPCDKKLPYLIKNRANNAILKGIITRSDLEASTSANAAIRKLFGPTMPPPAKAQHRSDGLTPCLTPGCANAPMRMPVSSLFAQVEYKLRSDPRAVVKLHCPRCNRGSTYDYGALFALLPEKLRPAPLPEGVVFAVLLAELNTSASMPRSFFGERILTRVTNQSKGWRGRTLGGSQFCSRALPPGTEVAGHITRGHFVIDARRSGPTDVPLDIEEIPKGSCFAIMVSPRSDPSVLLSANAFCPNPSCMNVCSLTFTQFENAIKEGAAQHPDAEANIVWECNMCHATMMVGKDTFNDLYKT